MKVNVLRTIEPRILIPVTELKKMTMYGDLMKGDEIAWLGFVDRVSKFEFRISKVFLIDQEVSSTTVDVSVQAQVEKITELLDSGMPPEEVSKIRFHGHWHPHNSTSPSYTDEQQLKEFMESVKDFFVYAIATPKGDWKFVVSLIDAGIELEDVPWEIEFPLDLDAIEKEAQAEIDRHVKKKKYKYENTGYGGNNYTAFNFEESNLPYFDKIQAPSEKKWTNSDKLDRLIKKASKYPKKKFDDWTKGKSRGERVLEVLKEETLVNGGDY
jgi:hypothetical protein